MTYKLKAWTGPTLVKQLAEKMREAGVTVVAEGTEHVYFEGESEGLYASPGAAGWNVLVQLRQKHGTDFGLKPTRV